MRWILAAICLMIACNEERVYECAAWDERNCVCPSGEDGTQECSRGPAFADPKPPRTWKKCSCCFITRKGEHGLHYRSQNLDAGCWDDVYDPSEWDLNNDTRDEL